MAHRTLTWSLRTSICLEFTDIIVEVCEDLELLSSQASADEVKEIWLRWAGALQARQSSRVTEHKERKGKMRVIGATGD